MIGSDGGVVSWRGSCEWNIPGQSIIRLHLCFGGTGVMSRRGRREPIFQDDRDRGAFWRPLAEACGKTGWEVQALCLMGNHFHLVVEDPAGAGRATTAGDGDDGKMD